MATTVCMKRLNEARANITSLRFANLCALAECFGWVFVRQSGSHRLYKRNGGTTLLKLPGRPEQPGQAVPGAPAAGGDRSTSCRRGTVNHYGFSVRWSDEDEAFVALCPEFPGLSAFGESAAEALEQIQVAVDLAVETHQAEGWQLPEVQAVSQYSGQFRLRMPRSLHGELAARAEAEGVSLNGLAVTYIARGLGSSSAASLDLGSPGRRTPAR